MNSKKNKLEHFEKKISPERWNLAQNAEKKFWKKWNEENILSRAKHYEEKGKKVLDMIKKYTKLGKKARILQIGCAANDTINYLPFGERHSIDPLADFYKSRFSQIVDYDKAHFKQGVGESLPYEDGYFDLVLVANVLDHSYDADKFMSEVNRVLKDKGILYFECHFYQKSFLALSKVYGFFKKIFIGRVHNIYHPYMFSLPEIQKLMHRYFHFCEERFGEDFCIGVKTKNIKELKKKMRGDKKFSRRLPAIFGLLGAINYTSICKKVES